MGAVRVVTRTWEAGASFHCYIPFSGGLLDDLRWCHSMVPTRTNTARLLHARGACLHSGAIERPASQPALRGAALHSEAPRILNAQARTYIGMSSVPSQCTHR